MVVRRFSPSRTAACGIAGVVIAIAFAGCSDDDSTAGTDTTSAPTAAAAAEPPQAAFDVTEVELLPVPGGDGTAHAASGSLPEGYTEAEHLLSGIAAIYTGSANEPATPTGDEVDYVTRLLVRQPADPRDFSGRVFVEPFNTSGGADADVLWAQIAPLLVANGDAWVGVTERASSVAELQAFDAVRYAEIDVPANDVAWDILRQVGGRLKEGGDGSPLGDLTAERVYMGGYSQSGVEVATFAGAISTDTRMEDGTSVYDGFLPAAHSGSLTPLRSGTAALPPFEFEPVGATDVPVIDIETQADVEGFIAPIDETTSYTNPGGFSVRQDDSDDPEDLYRLYEVAGAPHAPSIPGCDGPGSTFPMPYFLRGAVEQMIAWAEDGTVPVEAPRLDLATTEDVVATAAVDDVGNATGGVRSPFVDVPLARYEVHSRPGALCKIAGREEPLPASTLSARYDDAQDYLDAFTQSLDATIEAGHLTAGDREAILEEAQATADDRLG